MINERKHKVFIYGTLMRGLPLNGRLPEDTEYQEAWIKGDLYSLGGCPTIMLAGDGKVIGEVISVDDDTLDSLDQAEHHPDLYMRKEVDCHVGERDRGCMGIRAEQRHTQFQGRTDPQRIVERASQGEEMSDKELETVYTVVSHDHMRTSMEVIPVVYRTREKAIEDTLDNVIERAENNDVKLPQGWRSLARELLDDSEYLKLNLFAHSELEFEMLFDWEARPMNYIVWELNEGVIEE